MRKLINRIIAFLKALKIKLQYPECSFKTLYRAAKSRTSDKE